MTDTTHPSDPAGLPPSPLGRGPVADRGEGLGALYLVATPRPNQSEADFLARVEAALSGGVDTLQLRCKPTDPRYAEAKAYIALAEKVRELARPYRVPLFVNDRIDVALAAGADGVHLGQGDLPTDWARKIGPALLLGRSTHQPSDALNAVAENPDYFAVGPVYATPTKPDRQPATLEYVRHVAQMAPAVPWYAIGGIDLSNLEIVLDAGASRVAVVRAILDAADPAQAARSFREVLDARQR